MPETLTDAQKVLRNDTGIRMAAALEALASEVEPSTVIAPEYDPTLTYAVGDLVIRRSVLYRCTTPIPTPEEWTAAHWTATSVSDEYRPAAAQDVIDANQLVTRISGSKVSIIGDSIGTFTGYNPTGYETHYPSGDVTDVTQTWWMRLLNSSGAALEVNASYGRSRVTTRTGYPDFYERANSAVLGNPDFIIVELGTNDSSGSIALGDYTYPSDYTTLSETEFRPAFIKGMMALQANFPNAVIFAVILKMDDPYAKSIMVICQHFGITCIDCRGYKTQDGTHPNAYGMREISGSVLANPPSNQRLVTGERTLQTLVVESQSINISDGQQSPSADTYGEGFQFRDNANNRVAIFRPFFMANGKAGFQMVVERYVNSARRLTNLLMGVDANGIQFVDFQGGANAWLTALGLTSGLTATDDFSSLVTLGEKANANGCTFKKFGNVISISFQGISTTYVIGTNADVLFTLPSGYRPNETWFAPCVLNGLAFGNVKISTDGTCVLNQLSDITKTGRIYANITFMI